ncbi:MAG: DUF4249 family protein [Bacteroidales bacterium]|nr:DUF4249 family protein [Bacteroidales bacterium]
MGLGRLCCCKFVMDSGPLNLRSNDPVIEQMLSNYGFSGSVEDDYREGTTAIFSDRLFEGKNQTIQFYFTSHMLYDYYNEYDSISITIQLRSVTKDYYLYMQILEKHLSVRNDPLSEPVHAYSNVENGFGLFSGYSASEYKISYESKSYSNVY